MVIRRSSLNRRGPAHARQRSSDSPSRSTGRTRRWLIPAGLALLVALLGVGAGLQWTRPIPRPTFRPAVTTSVHIPGTSPSLPWPTTGSAALTMEGVGSLGQVGSTQPVPIASITKVMTAYVVLKDHPLGPGATGPAIPVTADTLSAYQLGLATQQSVVKVAAGENLTEIEALEGLLIPSGNDIATLLAEWDAGSTTAFIAKMNSTAESLGLTSTHFVDVSGLDSGSTSTAADLIRLGQAAMGNPTFSQIVSMGEVTLPVPVVAPDQLDGRIVAPWGVTVAVKAPRSPRIVGWPGLSMPARLSVGRLPSVVTRGTRIGVLDVDLGGRTIDVVLRASGPLTGPSALWRLTRA
jgi:hypothetical protein